MAKQNKSKASVPGTEIQKSWDEILKCQAEEIIKQNSIMIENNAFLIEQIERTQQQGVDNISAAAASHHGPELETFSEHEFSSNEPNIVCADPSSYDTAVHRHEFAVKSLNEKITQYEELFKRPITDSDFTLLKNGGHGLKQSFETRVDELVENLGSRTLQEMERKAYLKDSISFFNELAYFSIAGLVSIHRIRLEGGKAVFNKNDAERLMHDEYGIDLSKPEYAGLIVKFNNLKRAYGDLYAHINSNKSVIKIDPGKEALITFGGNRSLITIDPSNAFGMTINIRPLIGRVWIG
jgi:hypothetical protein